MVIIVDSSGGVDSNEVGAGSVVDIVLGNGGVFLFVILLRLLYWGMAIPPVKVRRDKGL